MSRVVVRRKPNDAERRRAQLQQARINAPKLGEFMPGVREVSDDLAFDGHSRLSQTHSRFTTYPPAQAHFVYACPLGDCDGVYDLNSIVFSMLAARSEHRTGVLQCAGHRVGQQPTGSPCGLAATYAVVIGY